MQNDFEGKANDTVVRVMKQIFSVSYLVFTSRVLHKLTIYSLKF